MDYSEIRSLVIISLFSEDQLLDLLVLKGGNAINLIYGYGSRSSLDIDCSIDGDFLDPDEVGRVLQRALQTRFRERGLEVFDFSFRRKPSSLRPEINDRWGGYAAEFKIIDHLQLGRAKGGIEQMRRIAVEIGPRHQPSDISLSLHIEAGVAFEKQSADSELGTALHVSQSLI